jgi:hypothetical protein
VFSAVWDAIGMMYLKERFRSFCAQCIAEAHLTHALLPLTGRAGAALYGRRTAGGLDVVVSTCNRLV